MSPIASTLNAGEASGRVWDVVVVGAGLAGGAAALGAAQRGLRTLVIDKSAFPRPKLCGGCLTALGIETLDRLGVADLLDTPPAPIVRTIVFRTRGRRAEASAPSMRVIARDAFDAGLLAAARDAGAEALLGASARIVGQTARVRTSAGDVPIEAHTIIDAAGLRGASPADADARAERAGAHIGFGAAFESDRMDVPTGVLLIAAAPGGYLGLVRLADGRVNAAAAASASTVRAHGGPAGAARAIAAHAGLDADRLPDAGWIGAPALTRTRPTQDGGVFRVGDAAAFVEPITGEGMSWALATGEAVVEHAARRVEDPAAAETWPRAHRRLLGARLGRCSIVARAARFPRASHLALRALGAIPGVRDALVARLAGSAAGRPA